MISARALPWCPSRPEAPTGQRPSVLLALLPGQTRGSVQAGQGRPTSGFPVSRPGRPQAWISAEAGDPLGPDLCSLSLGRASCQGDDRIEFRVKGTNLVCLILSPLSLPPSLHAFFFLISCSHKKNGGHFLNGHPNLILLKQDLWLALGATCWKVYFALIQAASKHFDNLTWNHRHISEDFITSNCLVQNIEIKRPDAQLSGD